MITLQTLSDSQYRDWYLAVDTDDPDPNYWTAILTPTLSDRCLWQMVDAP